MRLQKLFMGILTAVLVLTTAAFDKTANLAADIQDDNSILLTVHDADEGTEAVTSITIGDEFPALDVITELEGDSCVSVTLIDENTGREELVLIEAFKSTGHHYVPAGDYTVRFLVKNKATGGTITIKACDGADGLSEELAAMLATDDAFPPFSTVFGDGGIDEAISRAAANSERDGFTDEAQLIAAVPLRVSGFPDEKGGMDVFAWVAVYALRAEEDVWTAVGYSLAPVKMNLMGRSGDIFFEVSDIRWGIDGENAEEDLKDMCSGYEGLAEEMTDPYPTGEEANAAFIPALKAYLKMHALAPASKLVVYGSEFDLTSTQYDKL